MLQIGDLETMARERLAVVVVVFNNFRLGSQRGRVASYGTIMGVDHTNPDFAKLAELFGCHPGSLSHGMARRGAREGVDQRAYFNLMSIMRVINNANRNT